MHTFSRTLALILLTFAAALLIAGCGGSDDDSGSDSGGDSGSTSKTTETDDSVGDSGGGADGKALFAETCGGCHVLSDAGSTGAVGPNLDETKPDAAKVSTMIASGGGSMPPGLLEGEEADAVAEYVAGAAGK